MRFIRFLGKMGEHLLAGFVGMIFFPLLSLAYYLLAVAVAVLQALILLSTIPELLWNFLSENMHLSKWVSVPVFALIALPVTLAVIAASLCIYLPYITVRTYFAVAHNFSVGLMMGLIFGWEGFSKMLFEQKSQCPYLFNWMRRSPRAAPPQQPEVNQENVDFNELHYEFVEESEEVLDFEAESVNIQQPLLDNNELAAADAFILNYAETEVVAGSELEKDLKKLTTRLDQYRSLRQRLDAVKLALEQNNQSEIVDEVIVDYEVKTPILLYKQYQEGTQWHNIPASGYITGKESFVSWIEGNPIHPLNNDDIRYPELYNGEQTRYKWHELTVDHCHSQELDEGAVEIRALITKLSNGLVANESQQASPGTSLYTLFAAQPTPTPSVDSPTMSGPGFP